MWRLAMSPPWVTGLLMRGNNLLCIIVGSSNKMGARCFVFRVCCPPKPRLALAGEKRGKTKGCSSLPLSRSTVCQFNAASGRTMGPRTFWSVLLLGHAMGKHDDKTDGWAAARGRLLPNRQLAIVSCRDPALYTQVVGVLSRVESICEACFVGHSVL